MASSSLGVGDRAPAFSLPNQHDQTVSLSDFAGRPLVVYFYPKDDTPGCTVESCTFRDQYEDFKSAGAEVIGISSDSAESHRKFAERHHLPFVLLADRGGEVRRAFGVPKTLGLMPGRVTYVIDGEGTIRHVFNSQLNPRKHVTEALAILRAL